MVNVNLAHLPIGHSHQEFQWEIPIDMSGVSQDSTSLIGVFDVYNKHNSDYEFNGYIDYELSLECNRCGKEFNEQFREDVRFIIKKNSEKLQRGSCFTLGENDKVFIVNDIIGEGVYKVSILGEKDNNYYILNEYKGRYNYEILNDTAKHLFD